MGKTDFSKVESALEEGLRRMTVGKLCQLADIAAGIGQGKKSASLTQKHRKLIRQLKIDFSRLIKKDSKIYARLKVKRVDIHQMLSNPAELEEKDWQMLEELRKKTEAYVKEYYPKTSDADLIEEEQERHLTKRFNVNEKWLPL